MHFKKAYPLFVLYFVWAYYNRRKFTMLPNANYTYQYSYNEQDRCSRIDMFKAAIQWHWYHKPTMATN